MASIMFAALSAALIAASALGSEQSHQSLRPSAQVSFISTSDGPGHSLRVCNAFASSKSLQIIHQPAGDELTAQGGPLAYKKCRDFTIKIKENDKIQLRAGEQDVGDFVVSSLPMSASSLLLVPHRQRGSSFAAFKSHVFSYDNAESAKVVTIDAYRGLAADAAGLISISRGDNASAPVDELLALDSVVDLEPGPYHVGLADHNGRKLALAGVGNGAVGAEVSDASMNFVAQSQGSYVVVRVGDQNAGGEFGESLLVFGDGSSARRSQHWQGLIVISLLVSMLIFEF